MSCSRWRYTQNCDGVPCPGNCDVCAENMEDGESEIDLYAKNDYISRQAAIEALGGNEPVGDPSKMDDDDVVKMWERIRIINIINKLPSAQQEPSQVARDIATIIENKQDMRVVLSQPEIIRCKDCKNWDMTWQNDWAKNYHYCPLIDGTRKGDWYCADAERKEYEK